MKRIFNFFFFTFFITTAISSCGVLGNIAGSGAIAMKEDPSIELTLVRLGDVAKAAKLSNFFMNRARVGINSTWVEKLNNIDGALMQEVRAELREKCAYKNGRRAVMPLSIFLKRHIDVWKEYKKIKPKEKRGEYKNFFSAFIALTGDDGKIIADKNKEITAKIKDIAKKNGRIEELKAINDQDATLENDRKANDAEIIKIEDELKVLEKETDEQFDAMIGMIDGLATRTDLVDDPDKMALAKVLLTLSGSMSAIQQQAAATAAIALIQFGRATVPPAKLLQESQAMVKCWAASNIADAPEKVQKTLSDIISVPKRLKSLSILLGKSQIFNQHVSDVLGKLTGTAFTVPLIEPMLD